MCYRYTYSAYCYIYISTISVDTVISGLIKILLSENNGFKCRCCVINLFYSMFDAFRWISISFWRTYFIWLNMASLDAGIEERVYKLWVGKSKWWTAFSIQRINFFMCHDLVFDQNEIILVGFYLYLNVHMFIDFTSHVLQIRCMFKN